MDVTSKQYASSLAFSAFSTTLFIFSLSVTSGNISTATVVPMGLFYGGLILLLAGMISFKVDDIFTATTALSYSGFWMAISSIMYLQPKFLLSSGDVGIFYLAWAVFTLYVWIASWKRDGATNFHYLLWLIALILLFIGGFTGGKNNFTYIGGWFAFASALVGWYIAAANLFNETFGRYILKIGKSV